MTTHLAGASWVKNSCEFSNPQYQAPSIALKFFVSALLGVFQLGGRTDAMHENSDYLFVQGLRVKKTVIFNSDPLGQY